MGPEVGTAVKQNRQLGWDVWQPIAVSNAASFGIHQFSILNLVVLVAVQVWWHLTDPTQEMNLKLLNPAQA